MRNIMKPYLEMKINDFGVLEQCTYYKDKKLTIFYLVVHIEDRDDKMLKGNGIDDWKSSTMSLSFKYFIFNQIMSKVADLGAKNSKQGFFDFSISAN